MKMDEMNAWLEHKGYTVARAYIPYDTSYRFDITKDGNTLTKRFKYPHTRDVVFANKKQREFLEDMDREFYKRYVMGDISEISKCPICGRHPDMTLAVMLVDQLDDDANEISCCGYRFTASSQEECLRKWNQHVESRNKLMNGFMFNTPLSNSIQKEVELMNNYMADVMNAATAHRESMELFRRKSNPQIKKVHFNKPVTCVIWTDGTKTLVRAQDGEKYDPEKGMALAIAKKFLGNKGNYYNVFDKWLSEIEKVDCKECPGTDHGKKNHCTRNEELPCPTKKEAEKSRKKNKK